MQSGSNAAYLTEPTFCFGISFGLAEKVRVEVEITWVSKEWHLVRDVAMLVLIEQHTPSTIKALFLISSASTSDSLHLTIGMPRKLDASTAHATERRPYVRSCHIVPC